MKTTIGVISLEILHNPSATVAFVQTNPFDTTAKAPKFWVFRNMPF